MTRLTPLVSILILLFLYSGCSRDPLQEPIVKSIPKTPENQSSKNAPLQNLPIESSNELIVQFKQGVSTVQKQAIRQRYEVKTYQTCNCSNQQIEKWEFKEGIDIEGRKGQITQDDVGIESVDNEFSYLMEAVTTGWIPYSQSPDLIRSRTKANNAGITIAILDTGIHLQKLPVSTPFLYNPGRNTTTLHTDIRVRRNQSPFVQSSQRPRTPCSYNGQTEISGWDFVNHDFDTFDDHGHGTKVANVIITNMENEQINNYQILPVKVMNDQGKGSYFDLICGYIYASKKESVSIINMSFGWYNTPFVLLPKLMSENTHITHITSAGNSNKNTDFYPHYPSAYPFDNVIAVGSFNEGKDGKVSFSNYGRNSVDFLSLGTAVPIEDNLGDISYAYGTSFAAPFVAVKAAKHKIDFNETPLEITNRIYTNGTPVSFPTFTKYNVIVE
ncbi:S8 family serine peptidase [Aquimarina hainanensis]|uniref:S8 family serine peptidase n=1 Tax=Aquimarina hainanensis TaxID=1578017 RepID=A0ABW5N4I4_9FLAO